MEVEDKLLGYFAKDVGAVVKPETNLIEEGIIDSMGIVEMVTFVSEEFGVEFEVDDMTEENLSTVQSVSSLIREKLN